MEKIWLKSYPKGVPAEVNVNAYRSVSHLFDENVGKARAALASTTDESMMKTWTLKNGGQTIFAMPRAVVMRSFVMNHMVHHRAQLGVYLRMNDVPVPALYGPTADEGM